MYIEKTGRFRQAKPEPQRTRPMRCGGQPCAAWPPPLRLVGRSLRIGNFTGFVLVLTVCLFSGCHRKPEAAADTSSFTLEVTELASGSNNIISTLYVSAKQAACLSIQSEGFEGQAGLSDAEGAELHEATVLLSATRIAPEQSSQSYIQVFVNFAVEDSKFGAPVLHTIPTNVSLPAFFSICASNGVYKFDAPVTIAMVEGKPMKLVVGKPLRPWFEKPAKLAATGLATATNQNEHGFRP